MSKFSLPCALLLLSALLCGTGCTSSEAKQTAGGAATATTLLVALPLVPVAGAYHAVTGDVDKEHAREEAKNAELDPIYEARRVAFSQRNPKDDADAVFHDGFLVFLPYESAFVESNRVKMHDWRYEPFFYADYEKALAGSPVYKSLCEYVFELPERWAYEKKHGILFSSETYLNYRHAVRDYVSQFNERMREKAPPGHPKPE